MASKNGNVVPSAGVRIDIGISEKDRGRIAEGLSRLLADSYTLYLMTHNLHWNVKGPMFNSLHAMFLKQYTEQWNALDQIAERIRALGYPSPGTYSEFSKRTSIKEIAGVPKALDMVRHLVNAQESTARTARAVRRPADAAPGRPRKNRVDAAQPAGRVRLVRQDCR
jgi:starvation-inducible DNA-binding protein